MITIRRANERRHYGYRGREHWHTFASRDREDPLADGFGALMMLSEDHLPPGQRLPSEPARDSEIVTYVREGALAHEDSAGDYGIVPAGEFQRRTIQGGNRHRESNASRTSWTRVFRIGLRPTDGGLEPGREQRRFSEADRRGLACVVASPDARGGSLRIQQDVVVVSTLLDPGHHHVYEIAHGRCAWLHVVRGRIGLGDDVLSAGDGAGLIAERSVSLTACEEAEVLLLDLDGPQSISWRRGRSAAPVRAGDPPGTPALARPQRTPEEDS